MNTWWSFNNAIQDFLNVYVDNNPLVLLLNVVYILESAEQKAINEKQSHLIKDLQDGRKPLF